MNKKLSIFGLLEIKNEKIINVEPLKGGVSCEIYKVDTTTNSYCIKKALKKLRVEKDWYADPIRSYYEYLWLKKTKKILPSSIPEVISYNRMKNYLIIEYLNMSRYSNLKEDLLKGKVDLNNLNKLAKKLLYIHKNLKSNYNKKIFQPHNFNFIKLRINPYLLELNKTYPELKKYINATVNLLRNNQHTVIHADFTPKNILVSKNKQIILDAETANYGDPSFDIVSLINHLIIKLLFVNKNKKNFVLALKKIFNTYHSSVTWEEKQDIIERSKTLLPLMILARVDGKSPVEYIKNNKEKNKLRRIAVDLIKIQNYDFDTFVNNL